MGLAKRDADLSDLRPKPRRTRFGLRGLLATILVLAMAFAWIGNEHRRVQRRTVLVAELSGRGVPTLLEEPTALGLFLRKRSPESEAWIADRIGAGWLSKPTVFLVWSLEDRRVPGLAEKLRRVGTVREVQYHRSGVAFGAGVSRLAAEMLRRELPGVGVVAVDDFKTPSYYRAHTTGAQLALGGLLIELGLFAVTAAALISLVAHVVALGRRRLRRVAAG